MFSDSRLKECRMEKYYSQSELANLLKINRAPHNKWESGKSVPNQKNLSALIRILDVPTTYFESKYKIINTYLQLSSENKDKVDEYAEGLLQAQESHDNVFHCLLWKYYLTSFFRLILANRSLMNTKQRPSMPRKNSTGMILLLELKEFYRTHLS